AGWGLPSGRRGQAAAAGPALRPLGPGCCAGLGEEDGYRHEAGLSTERCLELCREEWPRCLAAEHNSWYIGTCSLFLRPASGLDCPLSSKAPGPPVAGATTPRGESGAGSLVIARLRQRERRGEVGKRRPARKAAGLFRSLRAF
ncbi:unnamed protein product, partial [Prorocentrum cordatum]